MRTFYTVERHGGRRSDRWRNLTATVDEAVARAAYDKASGRMRQGSVRLMKYVTDDNGRDLERPAELVSVWAPNLRTRW